ncbi:MAG: T9SS type A sorting domain-containing protein [Bacteroidetes bacterium]|nr:T9SS type A sorting domain-containing protein [Bacteroidota bacterium]
MKSILKLFFVLQFIFTANILLAQVPDLILHTDVDDVYENYLIAKEAEYDFVLRTPFNNSTTMKAYIGKAVINLVWIQIDGEDRAGEMEPVLESLGGNFDSLDVIIQDEFASIKAEDLNELLTELRKLFLDPRYSNLRDRVERTLEDLSSNFNSAGEIAVGLFDDVDYHMQIAGENLESVMDYTADFQYNIKILGADVDDSLFTITRNSLNNADDFIANLEDAANSIDDAQSKLDSLMNLGGGSTTSVIDSYRDAVASFDLAAVEFEKLLTAQPFSPLNIDTEFITNFRDFLTEADAFLTGKEYDLDVEGKTIRPIAVLENLPAGLDKLLLDFYRTAPESRYEYTFGNLFPSGLPSDAVDALMEDMIINGAVDKDEFLNRMRYYRDYYLTQLPDPENSEAHLAVAISKTYLLLDKFSADLEELITYLEAGNFRDIEDRYTEDSFDYSATTDSIKHHFNIALEDDNLIFTILIKTNEEIESPYQIGAQSDFSPNYIFNSHLYMINSYVNLMIDIRNGIVEVLDGMGSEVGEMFEMDLDPNKLDFSNAESLMDFILVLEASNPDFMKTTEYGIEQFYRAGEDLHQAFIEMSETSGLFNDLIMAIADHQDDFNMDGESWKSGAQFFDDMMNDIRLDFEFPDSTVTFDGLRVNLSAWFYNPPENFLRMVKWFIDDDDNTDNTLGGLFPDGLRTGVKQEFLESTPSNYTLSQNYPNPFNPATVIKFQIPDNAFVTMKVYDLLGREIQTLVSEELSPGSYSAVFNAASVEGGLTSGVYFYRITAESKVNTFMQTKKLMLLK